MRRNILGATGLLGAVVVALPAHAGGDFRLIDRLSNGTAISEVTTTAISRNGSTVVGTALVAGAWRGFSWTREAGATLLPLGDQGFFSEATDVNDNGQVIVGTSGATPVAWRAGKFAELEHVPDQAVHYSVRRISADGRVAVGTVGSFSTGYHGIIWHDGEQQPLPSGMTSPTALSADGNLIFGYGSDSGGNEGVGRAVFGGKFELISAGTAEIVDVSYDGSIAVGTVAQDSGGAAASRWDSLGTRHSLFEGDSWNSSAAGVSSDGRLIVGNHELLGGFIWDVDAGAMSLTDYFTFAGVNLEGWSGLSVVSISAEGTFVTGTIVNPDGKYVGWIATIPAPSTTALLTLGLLGVRRRR